MAHIVTAPLVITKNPDGSDLYLYQGTQVPEHVKADELKRLESDDLVKKVAAAKKTDESAS